MEVEDQEFVAYEGEYEGEQRWTTRDRTITAKMDQYLNESDHRKVEIEDLELVLGPEGSEVDLICILMNMVCGEVKRGAFGPRGKDADLLIYDMGSIAQKP